MKTEICSDSDDDSDTVKVTKQYFIDKINEATDRCMKAEDVAPARGGWDPVFRKKIESKSQVSRAWMTTVQSIIVKAKFHGFDLSKEFSAKSLDEE